MTFPVYAADLSTLLYLTDVNRNNTDIIHIHCFSSKEKVSKKISYKYQTWKH